jgi:hypothetical protein
LTPFYPHPAEFVYAVDHAIECGAKQLEESFRLMRDFGWVQCNEDDENSEKKPICGNAYVGDVWYSQILDIARKFGVYQKFRSATRSCFMNCQGFCRG